jgi:hypothetical protein
MPGDDITSISSGYFSISLAKPERGISLGLGRGNLFLDRFIGGVCDTSLVTISRGISRHYQPL